MAGISEHYFISSSFPTPEALIHIGFFTTSAAFLTDKFNKARFVTTGIETAILCRIISAS